MDTASNPAAGGLLLAASDAILPAGHLTAGAGAGVAASALLDTSQHQEQLLTESAGQGNVGGASANSSLFEARAADFFQAPLGALISSSWQQVAKPTRNYYQWLSSFADPRVESWPMMSSPLPSLSLFVLYLLAANYGPALMRARKPLQLRWLLVAYNLYVSLLNLWIACELCYCSYKLRYTSMCQLVHVVTDNPYVMRIANGVWWYYASKGIEFADTLFFILRKKDRQLTFLHKYHHSSMFIVWWTAARFVPGGSAVIPIVVNSLVHVLMYAYYGLSALGPAVQKYLWWKRYLTQVQLIQFFVGVSIGIHLITSNCQFTRWMQYVFSGYAFSFIILFGNFYLNEYIKGRQEQQRSSKCAEQHKLLEQPAAAAASRSQNGAEKIKKT